MSPRAVVFDIGNVLIEWNPERMYDRVIGEARRRAMFEAVDLHGMNIRVDAGANWINEVRALASAHPDFADEVMLWHDRWIEMASPVIPQSVRIMEALQRKGIPVFALTNFGIETYDHAVTHYPFFDRFDRAFVSGRLGVMKPEARIYEIVEAVSGLRGAELIFADDRPENIAAAEARGWKGHVFTGPEGWAARLVAEGLLTAEEAA
jgi:2-haloacid dehalogenase